MLDLMPFLSSSPPKSSESGGKGLNANAFGLSTGSAVSLILDKKKYGRGYLCHDCNRKLNSDSVLINPETRIEVIVSKKKKNKTQNIIYAPGSRTHGNHMGHGNSPVKEFKAAKCQAPCLPSPPFLAVLGHPFGSACSLVSIIASETQRHRLKKKSHLLRVFVSLWRV